MNNLDFEHCSGRTTEKRMTYDEFQELLKLELAGAVKVFGFALPTRRKRYYWAKFARTSTQPPNEP